MKRVNRLEAQQQVSTAQHRRNDSLSATIRHDSKHGSGVNNKVASGLPPVRSE